MDLPSALTNDQLIAKLTEFNSKNVSPLNKVKWEMSAQKECLAKLVMFLQDDKRQECYLVLLQSIKVLVRNKSLLDFAMDKKLLEVLLKRAGLDLGNEVRKDLNDDKANVILEAQRCLSNIYLQCGRAQDYALENDTLPGIMQQTIRYKTWQTPAEIVCFDMKLLFLVTAQRPEARTVVVLDHRGLIRLTDVLDLVLERTKNSPRISMAGDEYSIAIDVLKAIFNLTCGYEDRICDEEEYSLMKRIGKIVQTLIMIDLPTNDNKFNLVCNCVNLLTNFKGEWMSPLIEPPTMEFLPVEEYTEIEYDGKSMNVPQTLLDYLDHSISKSGGNKAHGGLRENLAPILKTLVTLSSSHKNVRKFFRQQVLPPLRDVSKRPEEGNTLRNKLCRLLTSPDTNVSSMVAEFLFILCKEKVSRFVKHTGYGNAAGLLARRGLMLGGKGSNTKYSDTDTDSDTEEYSANAHKINPVTGYVEPPRPSPFEGMTEEQKEYEANKLANLIHQLHDLGAMKPARIGPDGKPVSVEHVLELVEGQDQRIGEVNESDED